MTPTTPRPPRVGIEHEFQMFDHSGSLDARIVLPELELDGHRLDPGDPHAVRCRWGGVITADGREAEIATPPVRLSPTAVTTTVGLARAGHAALAAALRPGQSLLGYSTHLNVEVDERVVRHAARLVAERMAPAVMLLLDRQDSPGLIIRPRHSRLELGGEFAEGQQLLEAMTMACGVALIAQRATRDRRFRKGLPPRLDLRLAPTRQRFGWYVDRRAGGEDLYGVGRTCRYRRRGGGTISADDILAGTWNLARAALDGLVEQRCLVGVDNLLDGSSELPRRRDISVATLTAADDPPAPTPSWSTPIVDAWKRDGVEISTVAATWHKVVMRAVAGNQSRWLTIAGEDVDDFVAQLNSGELDEWLAKQFSNRGSLRGTT